MKIVHLADVHIRNFKYREEYRQAFEDFYRQLRELQPDLVVNCGDLVHSKLAVSPELFDDVAGHMLAVTEIAPYWLILGNHDLNLKNPGRTDAISPIVRALQGRTHHELRLMGHGGHRLKGFHDFHFIHYDIRQGGVSDWHFELKQADVNIGLYHGSVSGCVTDQGFVMDEGEVGLDSFGGLDFVLLGDIHKRQSFRNGAIQYPGSLIQQNYGEELVKGFLVWDIQEKDRFSTSFHPVRAPHRFYTIQVPATLELPAEPIPSASRVRATVAGELTPSQRLELERRLRDAYSPCEIIIPDSSDELVRMQAPDIDSLVGSRDRLMREHLIERGAANPEDVIRLFSGYEQGVESDAISRGTTWNLRRIEWDDMLNYGEGNAVDLTRLGGLVGIFAPNASGKSSIFDILLEGLFDRVSKEVPRNVDLVNDNKDVGTIRVGFEAGGREFLVDRRIERISYGQRSLTETRQWGRTSLDFSCGEESLNGATRPETEKAIRRSVGTFEDFVLTSMVTQNPVFGLPGGADLLNCKETDRRKILFRMLDLDVYERVAGLVRDELKRLMGKLRLDREKLAMKLDDLVSSREPVERELTHSRSLLESRESELSDCLLKLADLGNVERAAQDLATTRMRYDAAADRLRKHCDVVAGLSQEIRNVSVRIIESEFAKPSTPEIDFAVLTELIRKLRDVLEQHRLDLSRRKSLHSSGLKTLKALDDIPCGTQFPTCRFIVDAVEFSSQRSEIEEQIAHVDSAVTAVNNELSKYELEANGHLKTREFEAVLEKLRSELVRKERDCEVERSQLIAVEQSVDSIGREVDDLERQVDAVNAGVVKFLRAQERRVTRQISGTRATIEDLLRRLGALQAATDAAQTELDEYDSVKAAARDLEDLAEMCGKNGLPYRILGLVLPLINAEIAKILTGIVRFSVFFEDDPDEQTVSLYIRYGDYRSRPLSLGSGAEKFIASLAIRVALLSVTSLPKTDILIIDEGFGKLDPEYLESLQRMFEYLRGAFGTVFIVSHVDFMRDIVDHSIEITSRDGYAHVEVQ